MPQNGIKRVHIFFHLVLEQYWSRTNRELRLDFRTELRAALLSESRAFMWSPGQGYRQSKSLFSCREQLIGKNRQGSEICQALFSVAFADSAQIKICCLKQRQSQMLGRREEYVCDSNFSNGTGSKGSCQGGRQEWHFYHFQSWH